VRVRVCECCCVLERAERVFCVCAWASGERSTAHRAPGEKEERKET
jgi:hypothetical protein